MARFFYTAVGSDGRQRSGTIEESTRSTALDALHRQGQVPLRLTAAGGTLWARLNEPIAVRRRVNRRAVARVTKELSSLLDAGLTLERAVALLIDTTRQPTVRALLARVHRRLEGGTTFADALAVEPDSFPPFYIGLVRAGETGGTLPETLRRLTAYFDKTLAFADSLKASLIYPAILTGTMAFTVVLVVTVVLPEFEPFFRDAGRSPPLLTQGVMVLGKALTEFWWLLLTLTVAFAWLVRMLLRRPSVRLRWDAMLMTAPWSFKLFAKIELARLFRTLGALLEGGVPLTSSLKVAEEVTGNAAVRRDVRRLDTDVRHGARFGRLLGDLPYVPATALQLVQLGDQTGRLGAMLLRAGDLLDDEVQQGLKRFLAIFVPGLTLAMGGVVAALIGSVLVTMLSINDLAL